MLAKGVMSILLVKLRIFVVIDSTVLSSTINIVSYEIGYFFSIIKSTNILLSFLFNFKKIPNYG